MSSPMIKPSVFILYGITGDLARRSLIPALYKLEELELLPDNFTITGTSRSEYSEDQKNNIIHKSLEGSDHNINQNILTKLCSRIEMIAFDISDTSHYARLKEHIASLEESLGLCLDIVHYLSVPPKLHNDVIANIGGGELNTGCSDDSSVRLLLEKPFGHSYSAAQELQKLAFKYFNENQIYLVDHFIAKHALLNIEHVLDHNIFPSVAMDSSYIERIDVIASETLGVEGRAGFYEGTGALIDMVQSHLLHVLTSVMARDTDTKIDVFKKLNAIDPHHARRGQYKGYKADVNNPGSTTETFAGVTISSSDDRWNNVLLRLASGKELSQKCTEAIITFKHVGDGQPTKLTFRLSPESSLNLELSVLSTEKNHGTATLHYKFEQHELITDGYETLLLSALKEERDVFASTDEAVEGWRIIQPVLDAWGESDKDILEYDKGTEIDKV